MEKLGINLGVFLFYLLNFTALLIVLTAWVYKPVLRALEDRKQKIAKGLEDAQTAAEARAGAEKEAQHILSLAQQEASRKLREASEAADRSAQEMRAAAEMEAAALHASAQADIESERNRMLADLRKDVAALAIAAAHKLVSEAMDESRQRKLIEEFFSGVRSGKVELLEDAGPLPKNAQAEVVSALPLTDSEQSSIRSEIASRTNSNVEFRVEPAVLGGLKIRVGDRVVDGTVAGKLEGLRRSLR